MAFNADLDISAPSASNSVGSDSPNVDRLLADSGEIGRLTSKRADVDSRLEVAKAAEGKSFLDELLAPQNLLKILGAGAAAASGNTALGAGIGLGALGGIDQSLAADEAGRAKTVEELEKQVGSLTDDLATARQQFTTAYQSKSEDFTMADGSRPDPKWMGFMLFGTKGVEMDPQGARNATKADDLWEREYDLALKGLDKSNTPEARRVHVENLFRLLGGPPPDEEQIQAFLDMGAIDNEEVVKFLMTDVSLGMSGVRAFQWGIENGYVNDMSNPAVMSRVQRIPPPGQATQDMVRESMEVLKRVRDWSLLPENLEIVDKTMASALSRNEGWAKIAELALAGDPTASILLNKTFDIEGSPVTLPMLLSANAQVLGAMDLNALMAQIHDIKGSEEITFEDLIDTIVIRTSALIDRDRAQVPNQMADSLASARADAVEALEELLPKEPGKLAWIEGEALRRSVEEATVSTTFGGEKSVYIDRPKQNRIYTDIIKQSIEVEKARRAAKEGN